MIQSLLASSLRPYNSSACMETFSQTSYKTLKINLAAVQLKHLEQGFSDPADGQIFHLVCRSIRQLQGDGNSCSHCPITINFLCTLKMQLSCILPWTMSTIYGLPSLWPYGLMRVSEFTSPSSINSFSPPGVHWSDV